MTVAVLVVFAGGAESILKDPFRRASFDCVFVVSTSACSSLTSFSLTLTTVAAALPLLVGQFIFIFSSMKVMR